MKIFLLILILLFSIANFFVACAALWKKEESCRTRHEDLNNYWN